MATAHEGHIFRFPWVPFITGLTRTVFKLYGQILLGITINYILLRVIQRNNLNRVRINEVDCITFVKLSNVLEWRHKKIIFLQHVYCVVINLNVKILQTKIKKKQQKKRKKTRLDRSNISAFSPNHTPPWYSWNIVESGIKHHKPTNQPNHSLYMYLIWLYHIQSYHFINTCT